nr:leucine-rich repeat-containing protein 37A3-like [Kogia breviceps]
MTLAQSNLTQVTIQPMDVELTVTAGSNMETVSSPIMQETPTQPPETPQDVVVQSPFQQELTVPTPSKDQGQHSTSSSITVHHVDLEQTTTPEPTMESGHFTSLQQTTAPHPKHHEVTLAQPNLTQVTVPPVYLGVNISQQPRPFETFLYPSTQYPHVFLVLKIPQKRSSQNRMPPQTSAYVSSVSAKMRRCRVLVSAQSRSSTGCLRQSLTPTMAPSPSYKNRLSSFVLCILPDMAAFLQVFLGPPYLPNPH